MSYCLLDVEEVAALDPEVRDAVVELNLIGFRTLSSGGGEPGIPAHVDIAYQADIDSRDVVAEANRLHQWAIESPLWSYPYWDVRVHLVIGLGTWFVTLADTTAERREMHELLGPTLDATKALDRARRWAATTKPTK